MAELVAQDGSSPSCSNTSVMALIKTWAAGRCTEDGCCRMTLLTDPVGPINNSLLLSKIKHYPGTEAIQGLLATALEKKEYKSVSVQRKGKPSWRFPL